MNLPYINHKDECKTNNYVENLEWCDAKYNANYGTRNNRISNTQKNCQQKSKQIICLETGVVYQSAMEVKRQLGLDNGDIGKCCNGKKCTCGGFHWEHFNA